jgi:hypothetical protein
MNRIVPYALWVGHAGEGRDFRNIFDAGIKAILSVAAEESPPQPPRGLICCHFPLLDGTGNAPEMLSLAITTIASLLQKHLPTLVSCGAGMSRAPAVVAAALSLVNQDSPEKCLQLVAKHHPSDVSPALWSDVTGILNSLH